MESISGPFLRPFLHLSKHQLEGYLTSRGLDWREDESNQSRQYKRNKIRLDLIPLMEELAGGREAFHRRIMSLEDQSGQVREVMTYTVRVTRQYLWICLTGSATRNR